MLPSPDLTPSRPPAKKTTALGLLIIGLVTAGLGLNLLKPDQDQPSIIPAVSPNPADVFHFPPPTPDFPDPPTPYPTIDPNYLPTLLTQAQEYRTSYRSTAQVIETPEYREKEIARLPQALVRNSISLSYWSDNFNEMGGGTATILEDVSHPTRPDHHILIFVTARHVVSHTPRHTANIELSQPQFSDHQFDEFAFISDFTYIFPDDGRDIAFGAVVLPGKVSFSSLDYVTESPAPEGLNYGLGFPGDLDYLNRRSVFPIIWQPDQIQIESDGTGKLNGELAVYPGESGTGLACLKDSRLYVWSVISTHNYIHGAGVTTFPTESPKLITRLKQSVSAQQP